MKTIPTELIRSFLRDRTMAGLAAGLLVAAILYGVYVLLSLEQSDLQVATRYTAFGDTHFYRSKWYYLLSFVLFAIVLVGVHLALAIKLYGKEKRQLAIALLGLSFLMLAIGWLITRSVLGIAFL